MTGYKKLLHRYKDAVCSRTRNDEGSALVEMAISTILVMTVFLGIFELCMAGYAYSTVSDVARDSARWAMVRGSMCSTYTPNQVNCGAVSSDIQNHAKTVGALDWSQCTNAKPCVTASWMKATTLTGKAQTTTTWSACGNVCNDPGNLVVVNVSYPYTFTVPFVKTFQLTMGSQAQMVISQ